MASDIQRLARLDRTALGDLVRAAIELGIARLRLRSQHIKTLMAAAPATKLTALNPGQAAHVDRIAVAIPRVAGHLPWRADCLVQALAAKRWLAKKGISTTLHLGVRENLAVDFEAHAWLTAGDKVVTGGNIADYMPLSRN